MVATERFNERTRQPSVIVVHEYDGIRLRAGLSAVDIAERESRYRDDYQGSQSQHEQRGTISRKKAKFVLK
ncbi:MAG: hypothetical protein WAN81_18830 [Candidatus Binataceae bacterium]